MSAATRRTAWLAIAAWSITSLAPAQAHPLVQQLEAPVNEPVTVTMTVISEAATPMIGAEIALARSFSLDRVAPGSGWSSTTSDGVVHAEGPPIALGQAVFISLSGRFTERGPARFPVTTHAQDGTTVDWAGPPEGPLPAVVVYAGVDAPLPPGAERSSGRGWLEYAGIGLVAVGVILFVVDQVRRRRRTLVS